MCCGFFFFKQKTAYEMRISDWSSDVCSSDLQNKMQYDKVVDFVEDAKRNGARVLCGGEAPDSPGFFYPVTIVADATDGMRIVDEEQFGDRKSVVSGKSVSVRVDHGGRRIIKKKNDHNNHHKTRMTRKK